jgi:hypothetical protein
VQRDGVVYADPHAAFLQILLQLIALGRTDYKQVKVVFAVRRDLRQADGHSGEHLRVGLCMLDTRRIPVGQVAQFHGEHRGLNGVQTGVRADDSVLILSWAAVVAQKPQHLSMSRVIAGDGAGITIGTEVLAGIEAEARQPARTAYRHTCSFYTLGLRGVFDDDEVVSRRECLDRRQVHRTSV